MEYSKFLEKLADNFKSVSDGNKPVSVMINGTNNFDIIEYKDDTETFINIIVIGE